MKILSRKYLSLFLLLLGFILFIMGACKKPKGNDDDSIQPMYGVKSVVYKP